jgi:LmbE family N-acetylglucosaminyl deacetylase
MEGIINQSTTLHLTAITVYVLVTIYTIAKKKEIDRTTRRSTAEFLLVITVLAILTLVNLVRLVAELIGETGAAFSSSFDNATHYINIFSMAGIILLLISNKIVIKPVCRPLRILAIGAHPDDIEIAAGATLAKQRDSGNYVFGLILTYGTQGGNAARRILEARRGAKFLGLDDYKVHDFPDTRLFECPNEILKVIESTINQIKPDIIYTHSSHDIHQDHQVVHDSTLRAARRASNILCYESPSASSDFKPEYFVEVSDYVEVKIKAIREHWDQRLKPYVKPEKVRSKLAFRGEQARVDFAEGFEVIRMVSIN